MEKEKIEICGPLEEPLMENIVPEEINDLDSPSSSDTDNEKTDSPVPINAPIYRMFGRERSIHLVLGGGKPADVLLWRDKKITAGLVIVATMIWLLFEFVGCRLLTCVCRGSILFLLLSFLWSIALNNHIQIEFAYVLCQILMLKRLVVARDMKGKRDRVVVVIGNMTITAGQVYEAMSNAGY